MDYGPRNLKYDSDIYSMMDFPGGSDAKESACNAGSLGLIPLEKEMATYSSILAWRIP